VGRRSGDWIKLKCRQRQEFVIGGYSDPAGSRRGFGALLLGLFADNGKLHYAGRVGTGFDDALLTRLSRRLKSMEIEASPFCHPPKEKDAHWVKPQLVAEVAYAGWTREKLLRQASFLGLREDKPADTVKREAPLASQASETTGELRTGEVASTVGGVKLTHPDRFIWSASSGDGGITKTDLARYVERVGPWLLPHLAKRPLSLLRCPDGSAAECFFQKHLGRTRPVGVQSFLWEESSTGKRDYVYVESVEAVIGLVQRGIVEFHTWGSSLPHPDRPDRLTIDLDPAPDLPWQRVVEGAQLARTLLEELGLVCFLKTTGGKGLHIVTPLVPENDWPQVKTFAKGIAVHLAKVLPDRFTANMAKSRRVGRVFVDYLRNDEGATAVAAYSPRARPGAPVSLPLAWDELSPDLHPADWTLRTVPARLASIGDDPWQGYGESAKAITDKMRKALGVAVG
jgi:bifunctional non-homologous end joining protein LigD